MTSVRTRSWRATAMRIVFGGRKSSSARVPVTTGAVRAARLACRRSRRRAFDADLDVAPAGGARPTPPSRPPGAPAGRQVPPGRPMSRVPSSGRARDRLRWSWTGRRHNRARPSGFQTALNKPLRSGFPGQAASPFEPMSRYFLRRCCLQRLRLLLRQRLQLGLERLADRRDGLARGRAGRRPPVRR